nr:MAG TPA: hypothetical protein [Caudoviricetes sp.]
MTFYLFKINIYLSAIFVVSHGSMIFVSVVPVNGGTLS